MGLFIGLNFLLFFFLDHRISIFIFGYHLIKNKKIKYGDILWLFFLNEFSFQNKINKNKSN